MPASTPQDRAEQLRAEYLAHNPRHGSEDDRDERIAERRVTHAFERTIEMPREGRPPECNICLGYPNDPVHQVTP